MTDTEALNRITSYCATAEHCASEVVDKLKKWEIGEEEIERILAFLRKEKFIDEERYAASYITDKYLFAKWGKRKIYQMLLFKKIPNTIIQEKLNEIDKEEYLSILKKILDSKRKSIRAKNDYEFKAKLVRFALSRGFEMDDIENCISF
ncbi:MAG: RecX family transcriptional regulator [Bacteroides sp.]|nr:RecX family transcriptional regulator [Bacteroides sp.]